MRRVCVQVNMVRLSERLTQTWGRAPMPEELQQWLKSQGFTHHSGSQWYCDGPKIECLRADEIVRFVHLETENGVTIVDPLPALPSDRGPQTQ